jgi:hypothetical protein
VYDESNLIRKSKGGKIMTFHLENVYKRKAESPYLVYVPSKKIIEQLTVGNFVKLTFLTIQDGEYCGERMWVKITRRKGNHFVGTLVNEPCHLKNIYYGQEVSFGPEHICDTDHDNHDSIDIGCYFQTKEIISKDVLEKRKFNVIWREQPLSEDDSGWNIISGYEGQHFLTNINNYQVVPLGAILEIDDSILNLLDDPPLSAYKRTKDGRFMKTKVTISFR